MLQGTGTYGGFAPQPERYGGGRRRIEFILDALSHSDQTEIGLDVTPAGDGQTNPSNVWLEEVATARGIDNAWSTNVRGSNEFSPSKTMDMLPRWERIFGIVPPLGATLPQRRAAATFAFEALGKSPTPGQITDDLTYLGTTSDGQNTVFVKVVNTSSATGPSYYPGSGFSNPYDLTGNTTAGVSLVDWWSAVLNIMVVVSQPATMSSATFNALLGAMSSYLDGALPAWCTFCFSQSTGFFLDQANLSIEAFAT